MKTLIIQIQVSETEFNLLSSRYLHGEIQNICAREALHVLSGLVNEIRNQIPYVENDAIEE